MECITKPRDLLISSVVPEALQARVHCEDYGVDGKENIVKKDRNYTSGIPL